MPWKRTLTFIQDNQGSDSRRGAGLVLINVVGQCGPILGTQLFPTKEAPRYVKGMSVCAAFMFFTALLSLGLRFLLLWRNRKLDQRYGEQAGDESVTVGVEDYGPKFRFIL